MPSTFVGIFAVVCSFPSPSCPCSPDPHTITSPVSSRQAENNAPAATLWQFFGKFTSVSFTMESIPNCPSSFHPKAFTFPSAVNTKV